MWNETGRTTIFCYGSSMNSPIYVQVLGTTSPDTYPSLLFNIQEEKIVFNVAEGFQRSAHGSSIGISSLQAIYLTSLEPRSISGLPGALLSLEQAGSTSYKIAGPSGLETFMAFNEIFANRVWKSISIDEYPSTVDVEIVRIAKRVG